MTATDDEIRAAAEKVANACGCAEQCWFRQQMKNPPISLDAIFLHIVPIAREKWGVKEIAFRSPDEVIVAAQLLLPPGYWRHYANHESPATALLLALAQVAPEEVGE